MCVGCIAKKKKKRHVLTCLLQTDILVGFTVQAGPRGAVEKASFMQDGVGHGLGLGEVRKGQKSPQRRHATA